MTQIFIKAIISVVVILVATGLAKKFPSLAGLIGVMPITSVLVLIWVYIENNGDKAVMKNLATGSLFGLIPAILFFVAIYVGFRKELSLPVVLSAGFAIWFAGAFMHRMLLK
jgi:uncharacterized membrane protein (GlpM family)